MAKKEQSDQLNLTVVALVALVAIVGLVALVMNAASIGQIASNGFVTGPGLVQADEFETITHEGQDLYVLEETENLAGQVMFKACEGVPRCSEGVCFCSGRVRLVTY